MNNTNLYLIQQYKPLCLWSSLKALKVKKPQVVATGLRCHFNIILANHNQQILHTVLRKCWRSYIIDYMTGVYGAGRNSNRGRTLDMSSVVSVYSKTREIKVCKCSKSTKCKFAGRKIVLTISSQHISVKALVSFVVNNEETLHSP